MREWLVIENSWAYSAFARDDAKKILGYIPRDVAEPLLGRDLDGTVWFTKEEGERMRQCTEWTFDEPPMWSSPLGFWALSAGKRHD